MRHQNILSPHLWNSGMLCVLILGMICAIAGRGSAQTAGRITGQVMDS